MCWQTQLSQTRSTPRRGSNDHGKRRHEFMPKMDARTGMRRTIGASVRGGKGAGVRGVQPTRGSLDYLAYQEIPASRRSGKDLRGSWNLDITERKRAEEALRKQAELIDLTPDGIVTLHLDGTITFWNQGAQALYGWTSQEAIGQQSHTLLKTRFSQPLEQIIEQVRLTGSWSGELTHSLRMADRSLYRAGGRPGSMIRAI